MSVSLIIIILPLDIHVRVPFPSIGLRGGCTRRLLPLAAGHRLATRHPWHRRGADLTVSAFTVPPEELATSRVEGNPRGAERVSGPGCEFLKVDLCCMSSVSKLRVGHSQNACWASNVCSPCHRLRRPYPAAGRGLREGTGPCQGRTWRMRGKAAPLCWL